MIVASLLFAASVMFVAVMLRFSRRPNPPRWVNSWLITDIATALAIGAFALSIGFTIEFLVNFSDHPNGIVELGIGVLAVVAVVIGWRWCLGQLGHDKAAHSGGQPVA